jgi:hypothetical protein
LEKLEQQLGIPLPAATQWEIVEEVAELVKPARDELIRQAACLLWAWRSQTGGHPAGALPRIAQ